MLEQLLVKLADMFAALNVSTNGVFGIGNLKHRTIDGAECASQMLIDKEGSEEEDEEGEEGEVEYEGEAAPETCLDA